MRALPKDRLLQSACSTYVHMHQQHVIQLQKEDLHSKLEQIRLKMVAGRVAKVAKVQKLTLNRFTNSHLHFLTVCLPTCNVNRKVHTT